MIQVKSVNKPSGLFMLQRAPFKVDAFRHGFFGNAQAQHLLCASVQ